MTSTCNHLPLPGCRHDVLGHYLKAIGLLRVLAKCADQEHRDPDAEGWWDVGRACFCLRSPKYPTMERLVEFFEKYYRPTPLFAAWNKNTGATESIAASLPSSSKWEIAAAYSSKIVSAADRKKPANAAKLTSAEAFAAYRDDLWHDLAEVLDAIAVPRFCRSAENPLFLAKGIAGRAHLFSTYWEYQASFTKLRDAEDKVNFLHLIEATLQGDGTSISAKGKGTPFFPDAIKAYNTGSGWVKEEYPFNSLDYTLAMEGTFALRGRSARTIGATSKRFAAFPFVFDSGEDMVDDGNQIKGTAATLWLPVWSNPTTFAELASFFLDGQARLPGKEARFSAEFVRALNVQGVDAGFAGWQEFRFKMKGSRVPWITTGRYVDSSPDREDSSHSKRATSTRLNRALAPLDKSRFLDQFDVSWKGGKADSRSPHPVRTSINVAMEMAALEPTANHCMALLESIFAACRHMCSSKSFRERLRDKRASFFQALPMEEWNELLTELEGSAEFRIARAVASVTGLHPQLDGSYSTVQPMLGSLLPLAYGHARGWYLPEPGDRTHQDVWSGDDLVADLAMVLRRRYVDGLKDERPPLRAVHSAKVADVLAFLGGQLDDHLIARWIEAMSLIGWHFGNGASRRAGAAHEEGVAMDSMSKRDRQPLDIDSQGIEPAYAALRTLLELECEWQGPDRDRWGKRRSQQPFAFLCQQSASSLPFAVSEALRWISIWGVPNPWGAAARADTPRVTGMQVVQLDQGDGASTVWVQQLADRLAAAVCIPIRWQDSLLLYRVVTIPPGV